MDILNEILAALSVGLDALFPQIPIFPETVPSKVPPCCFLVGFAGGAEIAKQIGAVYKVSGKLDITYLTPKHQSELDTKQELNRVFAILALNLTRVEHGTVELLLKKHKRQDDGNDGILHDLCDFCTFLLPMDNNPMMGSIQIKEERLM